MLCNNCKNRDATFHKTTYTNGIKSEIHLCSVCAGATGVGQEIKTEIFNSLNIGEFFSSFEAPVSHAAPVRVIKQCSVCGTRVLEFQKNAMLGCANCYKVFKEELAPMVDMAHGAGVTHKGKLVVDVK